MNDKMTLLETEIAIKAIKDFFEESLQHTLHLTRVSSPLFLDPTTGLNDDLSGVERKVTFSPKSFNGEVEIIQSLAKWKRMALNKYGFRNNSGLYTDMNAIRMDEDVDAIHSIYVDQWDWEKLIKHEERTIETLKHNVRRVFFSLQELESKINDKFPVLKYKLPNQIFFITAEELREMYPDKTPKEREYLITKEHLAVCIMQIGKILSDGTIHDTRAADYDDWDMNADILLYHEPNDIALEISSMGIRVDKESLLKQLEIKGELNKLDLEYHKMIMNDELPFTIGGGIGQSRLCMYFLEKRHIGEVQVSIWPEQEIEKCAKEGIELL